MMFESRFLSVSPNLPHFLSDRLKILKSVAVSFIANGGDGAAVAVDYNLYSNGEILTV